MAKRKILIVDDEPSILIVLERILGSVLACDVVKASGGYEALDILETQPFDIVISDMRMPNMSGAELLDIVHELYPRAMRMVLSGRFSNDQGLSTVGSVHQYFLKPSDINIISRRLQSVLKLRDKLPPEGVGEIIARVDSLPSEPGIYHELETEINKPDASIEVIGAIIEKDMAMSAKILQLVNSAFFGIREPISRPAQAAALLGTSLVKSLVLAVHVFTALPLGDRRAAFVKRLWTHSLNVGAITREIAMLEKASHEMVEMANIAGLFHDIGKLVIAVNLPDAQAHIDRLITDRNMLDVDAERESLGATHAEIGAYLLALWGFPEPVMDAALFHGSPEGAASGNGFPLVPAVHLANAVDYEISPVKHVAHAAMNTAFFETAGLAEKMHLWRSVISKSG